MKSEELRGRLWRLRERNANAATIDREIGLLQAEILVDIDFELEEAVKVIKKVGLINFEELALRLEDFFRKTQD